MTTNERTKKINEHMLECFDNDIKALVDTIDANKYGNRTLIQVCEEVVQGGCFLVYYGQVNDFLKELDCKVNKSDQQNWSMYKKMLVKRMEVLYKNYKKENGGN